MYSITLNELHAAGACKDRYKVLLEYLPANYDKDAPITIEHIFDSNGLEGALWALYRIGDKDAGKLGVRFACDCVERVLSVYEDRYDNNAPRKAIEATKNWLENATAENAYTATYAAADAAYVAYAAYAAAEEEEKEWPIKHFRELLKGGK
jgi:hypothetical protein